MISFIYWFLHTVDASHAADGAYAVVRARVHRSQLLHSFLCGHAQLPVACQVPACGDRLLPARDMRMQSDRAR